MSRAEASALPRWELRFLIDAAEAQAGVGAHEAQGEFSGDEVRFLTTPGLAG